MVNNKVVDMQKVILFLICLTLLVSCKVGTSEIDTKYSSGVVLIQNKGYYELETERGSIYFADYDPEEEEISGLQVEEDSIEYQISYGTGFFISSDGMIATNKHVVASQVSEKEAQELLGKLILAVQEGLKEQYNQLVSFQEQVREGMRYAYNNDNYSDYQELDELDDAIIERKNELKEQYHALGSIDRRNAELKYHNEVSVAYNDTYVTNTNDFYGCVVKKVSEDDDLAIIQMKDKQTPAGRHIFRLLDTNPLNHYSLGERISKMFGGDKNEHLFMIGYNLGPALSITEEGVKAQVNEGSVSQKSAKKIMYSIPTLPGSSGSPVINKKGQLVAVNFSGLSATQNFNFGIPEEALANLAD